MTENTFRKHLLETDDENKDFGDINKWISKNYVDDQSEADLIKAYKAEFGEDADVDMFKGVLKTRKKSMDETSKSDYSKIENWVGDKLDNSDLDVDDMEEEFIKEFGKSHLPAYHEIVNNMVE